MSTQGPNAGWCQYGKLNRHNGHAQEALCRTRCYPDSIYCPQHRLEALERVRTAVPWEQRYAARVVEAASSPLVACAA